MGFKLKLPSFIPAPIQSILAPITAPIEAAVNIVQGGNVAESVVGATVKSQTGATAAVGDTLDALKIDVSAVPLGGSFQKTMDSAQRLQEQYSFKDVKQYGLESAKSAGIVAALASAPALFGVSSSTAYGGAVVGDKLLRGDTSGLFAAVSGATGVDLSALKYKDSGVVLPGSQTFFDNSSPSAYDGNTLGGKKSNVMGYVLFAGVLAGTFLILKRKRG